MPAVRKPYCAGQRAGDQLDALDEARVQLQAKSGDAFGQQHVVNAVLQVGVLAAHMQIPVLRRILRHAGKTRDDLIDRRVVPLRHGLDCRLVLDGNRGSQTRQDLGDRLIQMAHHRRLPAGFPWRWFRRPRRIIGLSPRPLAGHRRQPHHCQLQITIH